MKLNLVFIIGINSLINMTILRIVEAAPVQRFETATEVKEVSKYTDTSTSNNSSVEEPFNDDLQVAENRQEQEKNIKMFAKAFHRGSTTDTKTKQSSVKTSNINYKKKNTSVQLRAPKADSKSQSGPVKYRELTVKIPKFNTDIMGNWVYNPWGITFGDLFRDTRFNIGGQFTIPRMHIDSKLRQNYYPLRSDLSTVCVARTSPYNEPPVMKWLTHYMYGKIRSIVITKDFRENLYNQGHPDECHTSKFVKFLDYMTCAILRNQRMEYLIPYYPRHQNIPAYFEK